MSDLSTETWSKNSPWDSATDGVKILIVEDSPTQAERLRHLLAQNGHTVELVGNGAEALARIQEDPPDLVISDILMPEMNGFALCNQIKNAELTQDIPVILLTSLSDPEDVLEGLSCGADDFITKPYGDHDLIAHVNQILVNRKLWQGDRVRMGIEMVFGGRRRFITAEKQKMLTLLISTYEAAIHRNSELMRTQDDLNSLNEHLEEMVEERTAALLAEIAERKRIQETLLSLQKAVDTSGEVIFMTDRRGLFTFINPEFTRLYGYTSEEIVGITTPRILKSDRMPPGFYPQLWRDLLSKQSISAELINCTKDGRLLDMDVSINPILDDAKQITGFLAIQRDVTERKLNQARIETQLRRLSALRSIDLAITSTLDLVQTLHLVLEQTTAQLDMDAATVLLLDDLDHSLTLVAEHGFRTELAQHVRVQLDDSADNPLLKRCILGPDDADPTVQRPHLAGFWAEEGFCLCYALPLVAKNRVMGVLEIFRRSPHGPDAEWHEFLETLAGHIAIALDNHFLLADTQAQAQLTKQIIDTTPEGMLVMDRECRLLLANPKALDYVPALAELRVGDVVPKLGDIPMSQFLQRASQEDLNQEVTFGNPPRILGISAKPLTGGQQAGGWMLVLWDLTAERDRQRYQQMQEQLATVGQLAAGIAHDFNNIMGAIILYAQLLRRSTDLTDRQQSQLNTIEEQAMHATNLIRQILDFSRRSVMEKATLDVGVLVKESVRLLQRTLPESMSTMLDTADGDFLVFGDATRLQQAFMNLALNARDAMPQGGILTFFLEHINVAPDEIPPLPDMNEGRWVCLSVTDSGAGIDPAHLPHIFEPFFTTKAPDKGTGLGLAQVYGIVKQHDGFITVHSAVGQGTTFTVYLPALSEIEISAPSPAPAITITGQGETILLVEDNEAMRQSVADTLEGLGYQVLAASDGIEGLALLEEAKGSVDLVLSDMVMPRMGGMELVSALHKDHPAMKIMIMTGHPLGDSKKLTEEFELVTWIQKPFHVEVLAQQIRLILDQPQVK